jgi:hypothetical protein
LRERAERRVKNQSEKAADDRKGDGSGAHYDLPE